MNLKIGIVGSGNVAFHLVKHLEDSNSSILYLFHRNREKGIAFAQNFKKINYIEENQFPELDVLICAVNDSSMNEVLAYYSKKYFCLSTSGTIDSRVISENCGTMYPLQTFNKYIQPDFKSIPFFIDAPENKKAFVYSLTQLFSNSIIELSAPQRQKLHVAAVIANNFSNHLFDIAEKYSTDNEIDFKWLVPLIQQSVLQLGTHSPKELQTGPAKRNDRETIQKHIDLLPEDLKGLYKEFSERIIKRFNND